jgi:hypothetical protein
MVITFIFGLIVGIQLECYTRSLGTELFIILGLCLKQGSWNWRTTRSDQLVDSKPSLSSSYWRGR